MIRNKWNPGFSLPEFNLWHLFPISEFKRKLPTFIAGGLWCAQLNSITSFAGSVEAGAPYGYFVSCWHKSTTDPTPKAWEIFGAAGDGIAIRTKCHSLNLLLATFRMGIIQAAIGEVRYLESDEQVTNPAFEVRADHDKEEEMRIALTAKGTGIDHSERIRGSLKTSAPGSINAGTAVSRYDRVTFLDNNGDNDAIIIPVIPETFIDEILIGHSVASASSDRVMKALRDTPLVTKIRFALPK